MSRSYECHGHLMMDGADFAAARERHSNGVDTDALRTSLDALRAAGVTYFRDGGDVYGVSALGREIAPEYGIEVVTPVFAIHKRGYYGSIVGRGFDDIASYRQRIEELRNAKGDFVKLMFSGIITFRAFGELSCDGLDTEEIKEMVHIAHCEGYSVMAHVNGEQTVRAAAEAGVDSVEHGYFADREALDIMAEKQIIWVPTLAAVEAFRSRRRTFEVRVVILDRGRIHDGVRGVSVLVDRAVLRVEFRAAVAKRGEDAFIFRASERTVAAGHGAAEVEEHLRQAAHADAADADEVKGTREFLLHF